jgi:dihydrolipoamide dehydrogenase
MKRYDVAIIGSGPGGYVAALYAAGHKLNVCVIEKDLVGGTCLNRGCIGTKSLLASTSLLSSIKDAGAFGIRVDGYSADYAAMVSRKDDIVKRLRTGVEALFRAKKVDLIRGRASLAGGGAVAIEGGEGVMAGSIIIATGSRPAALKGIGADGIDILTSDGALELKEAPKRLVVIGGGVIGCEFASLFASLGSKVTIVEMTDRLLPTQSLEASRKLASAFAKAGTDVRLTAQVKAVERHDAGAAVFLADGSVLDADKVLVSVGRAANVDGIGLERSGVLLRNGRIAVDARLRTGPDGVYAIGDCVEGPQLAHKASYDAIVACDNILGNAREADYSNIPNCIWTDPEIASVGMTEEEARKACPDAKIVRFPYLASGRACIDRKGEGYVKIAGRPDGSMLGVEIMGKLACDLIGEATLAKTAKMSVKEWSLSVHGHPTLSEVLQEAAHLFCGNAIHTV